MKAVATTRVLLVDDSTIAQALIKRLLAPYPEIEVVGCARNGREGLQCVADLAPDLVCTDLFMPVMDGLAFTRALKEWSDCPVLVITNALQEEQSHSAFDLLAAGAVDLFYKPASWNDPDREALSRALAGKIKILAGLKSQGGANIFCQPVIPEQSVPNVQMVVIGAGVGGPLALREIFGGLGADFPVPILCVAHVDPPFHLPLIRWLGRHTALLVQECSHGEMPMAGSVYFPKAGHHLILDRLGCMVVSQAPPVAGHRPSITVTMESAVEYFAGSVIGVLLSGLGQDGVRGLAAISHTRGVTLAQDDASSVAFQMPRQVIELGEVQHVLPISKIATALLNLIGASERALPASSPPSAIGTPEVDKEEERQKLSLLIVEDSAIQAFKLHKFLQGAGFEVFVAKDGQEGLEMASRMRPALIISDVSMPRMNGFQLCRAIKSDPLLQGMPVILLTALTNPDEILEGLAAGANNYLVKPWEEGHLRATIDAALASLPERAEAGEHLEITFDDKNYTIASSRRQILNLLMTTYQKAVRQNKELMDSQLEMKMLNLQMVEMYARETNWNKQLQDEMRERKQMEILQARTLRELEEANRELDDFAFIIAHDLKTPLRGIGSLTNWLLTDFKEQLAEEGQDLVRLLAIRADRVNLLIEALLQYARVSRINEELTMVDLHKVVGNVIKGLSIPEEMEVLMETPLPVIHFQESRAVQIFHNLIDNAVRHMGRPVGVVRVGWIEEDSPFWHFYVSDNGPGIEERYFDKIFDVFQTLQPRDEAENAGMGLAVVRKIVEKYGGTIRVESQFGHGSVFHVTLPRELTPLLKVQGRGKPRS